MQDDRIATANESKLAPMSQANNLHELAYAGQNVLSLGRSKASLLHTDSALEGTGSKLAREALVLGAGIGKGYLYGLAELPGHWSQVGSSVAIGAALSAISKTGRLGAAAAAVIGASFATRFVLNTVNDTERWKNFAGAVTDTWRSSEHISKNIDTVYKTAGTFAFDTSLSLASGYIGYTNKALGDLILGALRLPPIVPNTPPIFGPYLASASMIGSITPPGNFYSNYNDRAACVPRNWHFDIHGTLRLESSRDGLRK